MKKAIKLLMTLSVMAVMLLGASTIALADNTTTVKIGSSNVTISADKDFDTLSLGEKCSVTVNYTIKSDNENIQSVLIPGDYTSINAKEGTVSHTYYSMDPSKSTMEITMADGKSATLTFIIYPAKYTSFYVQVQADSTAFSVMTTGSEKIFGDEYVIKVYKDSARKNCLGTYTGKTGEGAFAIKKSKNSWFKANTKYYLSIYSMNTYTIGGKDYVMYGQPYKVAVKTGPTTTPVIKSVKISNVSVKSEFDTNLWQRFYNTDYKLTVTLSKKASNIKGLVIEANGKTYTVKGTGKTFTVKISDLGTSSLKGKTAKIKVRTYSDTAANGYAYSPMSKTKTYTIKNGTKTY